MERPRCGVSLVVLTLLQLCRAEIKDTQPQWYSANIINDAFQPKPISELFSTEIPTFSTANPIIVSSTKGNSGDIVSLSTSTPSYSQSSMGPEITRSTISQTSTTFPASQPYLPQIKQVQQTQPQRKQHSVQIQQNYESVLPLYALLQQPVEIQQNQLLTQPAASSFPEQITTFFSTPPSSTTMSSLYGTTPSPPMISSFFETPTERRRIQFPLEILPVLPKPEPQQVSPSNPQNIRPQSNNFLINQQIPQSFGFPQVAPSQTTAAETSTPSTLISSTFSSSSVSTTPSNLFTTRTSLELESTTSSPLTPSTFFTNSSPRVTVTSLSTTGSNLTNRNCATTLTTPIPSTIRPFAFPSDLVYPLRIRIVAPRGSITNVNINPTTRRPQTTTRLIANTRKTTTRRTPKPKKNTYERCLQGCRKIRQNVCAAPLSQRPIEPKKLRGFPSVCHMACHNSYRNEPYEKIVDGSCGKLRTRIRPVDSTTKLKKDDLHKVEYILDNSGQRAVVEFSAGAYALSS